VARATTNTGCYLDVSVADGVLWLMALQADEHLATGAEPGPGHDILTGRYACYDTYQAADGRWLAVGAIEAKFFANLCRALGLERWIDRQLDDSAQAAIRADFSEAFSRRSRDEWVADLAGADTCVAPVLTVSEAATDAGYAARGAFVEALSADGVRRRQVGPLLAGAAALDEPVALPDARRTDTDELLQAAGVASGTARAWRAKGVVR
jgi:alpha-methylacyl-CoA racemase